MQLFLIFLLINPKCTMTIKDVHYRLEEQIVSDGQTVALFNTFL